MRLLFFLFGACVASLVWALVLMRFLDYEVKAYDDSYDLIRQFTDACNDNVDKIKECTEDMCDIVDKIHEENHEFRTEVVKLFEILSKCMR